VFPPAFVEEAIISSDPSVPCIHSSAFECSGTFDCSLQLVVGPQHSNRVHSGRNNDWRGVAATTDELHQRRRFDLMDRDMQRNKFRGNVWGQTQEILIDIEGALVQRHSPTSGQRDTETGCRSNLG